MFPLQSGRKTTLREQPSRVCKNSNPKKKWGLHTGHLIKNPECAKTYTDDNFGTIGKARSSFHLSILESVDIKTQNPVPNKQNHLQQVIVIIIITYKTSYKDNKKKRFSKIIKNKESLQVHDRTHRY